MSILTSFHNRFIVILIYIFCIFFSRILLADDGQEIHFTVLHTNDEHSALAPVRPNPDNPLDAGSGGFSGMVSAVEKIRSDKKETEEPVLLFSGGDFLGGTPYSWLILRGQAPELNMMILTGYDAIAIGNHEFDYGTKFFAEYLKASGYPEAGAKTLLLGSNLLLPQKHELLDADIRKTAVMDIRDGFRTGLIGLLGEHARGVATGTEDIEFAESIDIAAKLAHHLKQNEGADIVIALSHSGLAEDRIIARTAPEIDLIVGGHCHTALQEPVIEGNTIIVQAGSHLSHLGVLELAYSKNEGLRIRNMDSNTPFLLKTANYPPHEQTEAFLEEFNLELNEMIAELTDGRFNDAFDNIASSSVNIYRTPAMQETGAGNYITDAMRYAAEKATGQRVDFTFQANGQIRTDLVFKGKPDNLISLYEILSFSSIGMGKDQEPGYSLVSFHLTGEEVRRILEISAFISQYAGNTHFLQVSGLRYSYAPDRALLFTVPFKNIPVPSTRSLKSVERYTGSGRQTGNDADYIEIPRGDDTLYHVIADTYILSFLPMVGELLPKLEIVIRDHSGAPVDDIEKQVVLNKNGRELKNWMAVLDYISSHPVNASGFPVIPDYYGSPSGRITEIRSLPFILYPVGAILVFALIASLFFFRKKRRDR